METTKVFAVQSPAVALGSRSGAERQYAPHTLYREIWLEGFDLDKLRRVADCIMFFVEVTGSAACPAIVWERAEGFDVRWAGEPPAELVDRLITLSGTSVAGPEAEGRLRVA